MIAAQAASLRVMTLSSVPCSLRLLSRMLATWSRVLSTVSAAPSTWS